MEEQLTVKGAGLRYGVIAAIVLIIYGLILQIAGLITNQALAYINYLILAVIIFLAHKAYKEKGDGFMTFGQGLSIGVIISIISGVVSAIFSYIYLKFVDDSMLAMIREQSYRTMEEKGMSDEQIEQAMGFSEKFMSPEMILVFGIIGMVFFGFIISLIVALITKKNNPAVSI